MRIALKDGKRGSPKDATRCVPGGKATARVVKLLLEKHPPSAAQTPATAGGAGRSGSASRASADASIANDGPPSRERPAHGKLLAVSPLNDGARDKPVNHVALESAGTGLGYEPGDSPGVWPTNNPKQKICVQHRMREHATEDWSWLGEGAFFYVCGDAKRMAADVDAALKEIAVEQGGMDATAAAVFIKQLARDGRYCRDLY